MATSAVLDVAMLNAFRRQGRVEQDGILILHDGIVLTIDEEYGRTICGNVKFERKTVAKVTIVLAIVAQ